MEWKDGSVDWVTLKDPKQSNPVDLSEYALANEISYEPSFNKWSYMGINRSTLPQNNGNLPLPFFGGNCTIVLLNNINLLLYMYINRFTSIIFINDCISYKINWG